jgi:chaperonin GroES
MKLVPLADRVIIKPDEAELKTAGGIYRAPTISENADLLTGVVLAVGPGKMVSGMKVHEDLKPGEKVWFRRPMADKIEDETGQKLFITNSDCVVCKMKPDSIASFFDPQVK